jgi:hypothetical protein
VAFETIIGKNRPNLALKIRGGSGARTDCPDGSRSYEESNDRERTARGHDEVDVTR